MKLVGKILCTTVVGAALFGVSGFTALASADTVPAVAGRAVEAPGVTDGGPADGTVVTPVDPRLAQRAAAGELTTDQMRIEATRGFTVTNLSGNTLRLTGYSGQAGSDELPTLGSTVPSGGTIRFEITWLWAQTHDVTATFDVVDPAGRDAGMYQLTMRVHSLPFWTEQSSWAMHGSAGAVWGEGQDQYYGDRQGTVIDLPAGQGQAQADVLNRICTAGRATCSFAPTGRDTTAWTGRQQIGQAWGNERKTPYTKEFSATKSVELTQNVEVGASAKLTIGKIFEAAANAKYSTGTTTTETYSDKTTLTVDPGTMTWPVGDFPVIRDTGDFTVTLGNTTWILRDVTFTHPDPSRHATIVWREAPIGSEPVGAVQQVADAGDRIDTAAAS
ncbi:hypothetical protein [Nakamurella sp.]|uniref:hypothetical protein n=1 Tax=Nakamurella sp. TaxID=1869182 RepID=UPI003B3A9B30